MMKEEFEELLSYYPEQPAEVSNADYDLIEFVYVWHPSISDTKGKSQVVRLYAEFGIRIFEDMKPTADKAFDIMEAIGRLKNEISKLEEEYDAIRRGY